MIYVPGKLYSVNKATTENVSNLFSKNERVVCIFDTENGPVAVILVGAMIVASIMTTWAGLVTPPRRQVKSTRYADLARQPIELAIGEEMGRFLLGSTVIMVFPKDSMEWLDSIRSGTRLKVGQHIGQFSVPGDTVPEDTTSS
jgi:phosphatidylserine decarboxylase